MTATFDLSLERITRCHAIVRTALLEERNPSGHWVGELSASPLATATAVMALRLMRQPKFESLIQGGLRWLTAHQNRDGGWGDTVKSISNISTSMLARAVLEPPICGANRRDLSSCITRSDRYIAEAGGMRAVVRRYGKDRTFSVPILTHCALAGMVDWDEIAALPFELAWLPSRFYKAVRLPVVSYALPALIAIGQVRFHKGRTGNPIIRAIRRTAVKPTLRRLAHIQPTSGGFLEAIPLTSFVTMSLAAMGRADQPVAINGANFLVDAVRPDGSWPIDTNLATWVTTLSVNALDGDVPERERARIREWLLRQQYRTVHPYTNADPGGWAWTDLSGGVPDADDTPGAIRALLNLRSGTSRAECPTEEHEAIAAAMEWLLGLQNRDGGWPTFCRGWGALPFDRSAADISAHVLRAFVHWLRATDDGIAAPRLRAQTRKALRSGFRYLDRVQRSDGSWLPLWFGSQFATNDENPTYGTARVLAAYRDGDRLDSTQARQARDWLTRAQNDDGGWSGVRGGNSTVEETAIAVDALLSTGPVDEHSVRGLGWILERIESGTWSEPAPIGFYFAKLWYFERLYPQIFAAAALRTAERIMKFPPRSAECPAHNPNPAVSTAAMSRR